jgi:hypothetical protein
MPADLKLLPSGLQDKGEAAPNQPPSSQELKRSLFSTFERIVEQTEKHEAPSFMAFEKELLQKVYLLGRLLCVLFLCVREEAERQRTPVRLERNGRTYTRRPAQPRNLDTLFGVVRYFRTYVRGKDGHGYHPLDVALGLVRDRVSMNVLSLCSRLATMMSYARVHTTLGWFLCGAPSTEVIEQTVLGLGRRTAEWFERAPAPEDDGEVLIIQIDSKGAPTATETELQRRRGPRKRNPFPQSPRHRGREKRARYGNKPRRQKGDKSKNARMATCVVMYTLKKDPTGTGWLHGPVNRRLYASFAPKRHAFAIAKREAEKRGFTKESGKLIQIITDGDDDFALYTKELFPHAIHTVDVMHVIEYLYQAGECLYPEGSKDLSAFVDALKERLYGGKEDKVVAELWRRYRALPLTGPGMRGKRERLHSAIGYLEKRLSQMNYKQLLEMDLEVGSGAVEGAVKYLIGARFDCGGCRWIKERAEALLQLRCIDINGDWESFICWVHDDHHHRGRLHAETIRIQQNSPAPLPTLGLAA